jgi:hypothetical protein
MPETNKNDIMAMHSFNRKEQIFASNQNANHEDGEVMLKNFLNLHDRTESFVY